MPYYPTFKREAILKRVLTKNLLTYGSKACSYSGVARTDQIESFHQAVVSLDCDQATMVTQHGKPMFTKVCYQRL